MIDRSFFADKLPGLQKAYQSEAGAREPAVELLLREGVVLTAAAPVQAEADYVIIDYLQRGKQHRAVVPYSSIVAVGFAPEAPEHKGRNPVGFSI